MPNRRSRFGCRPRLAYGVVALLLLTGCGPAFERYHFISLENYRDARVVERAQATPGEHRFFVGEIPIRYEIEREGYTLIVAVHPTGWYPRLGLTIRPHPERRIWAERNPAPCTEWTTQEASAWWVYSISFRCDGRDPWDPPDKHLRFKVLDADGNVVAEEDIPYTIERDGFFMYVDAL